MSGNKAVMQWVRLEMAEDDVRENILLMHSSYSEEEEQERVLRVLASGDWGEKNKIRVGNVSEKQEGEEGGQRQTRPSMIISSSWPRFHHHYCHHKYSRPDFLMKVHVLLITALLLLRQLLF